MTWQKLSAGDLRTCIAGEALTQYTFVTMESDGKVDAADATADIIYGVVQETASAEDDVVTVAVSGVSKLRASAAIAIGAQVGTTTGAEGVTVTPGTTENVQARGMCVKAAAANDDICTVDLDAGAGWLDTA